MILSASRRTDIPAFYPEWFMNRIKEGYVLVRNPMNYNQISKIVLSPDIIDSIVFWTKDPKNMMPYLPKLDEMGYQYYFQFTLTPYQNDIERNLRDKTEIEDTFLKLSDQIGKERMVWRYDPIILNHQLTIHYHIEQFQRLCNKLHNYVDSVIISFVDLYSKVRTDLIRTVQMEEIEELCTVIVSIAKDHGLIVKACSEKIDLSSYGIEKASCIDKNLIENLCGSRLEIHKDNNQRKDCGCIESIDIGAYNTCLNGCIYCYANFGQDSIQRNIEKHNKNGEFLIGSLSDGEKIKERSFKSNKNGQLFLWT